MKYFNEDYEPTNEDIEEMEELIRQAEEEAEEIDEIRIGRNRVFHEYEDFSCFCRWLEKNKIRW